jgi:ABC-type amino acid transport substrate-binding protein
MGSAGWARLTAVFLTLGTAWLPAQVRKVTLTTLDWQPYTGEGLPGHGYACRIVAEAFRAEGYQVDIRFYPWARALAEAREGLADGLFPEYYSEERKADFIYSSAFPGGPVGFMARRDSRIAYHGDPRTEQAKVLQGLKQYTFGVVRGYINTAEFDHAAYLKKEFCDSDEQNINKLYNGRIDLIFIDKFVADYLVETRFPSYAGALEFLEPPLEVKPLYIVFSRKAPDCGQKARDFDAGLARLLRSGRVKAIMRQYGLPYERMNLNNNNN